MTLPIMTNQWIKLECTLQSAETDTDEGVVPLVHSTKSLLFQAIYVDQFHVFFSRGYDMFLSSTVNFWQQTTSMFLPEMTVHGHLQVDIR